MLQSLKYYIQILEVDVLASLKKQVSNLNKGKQKAK